MTSYAGTGGRETADLFIKSVSAFSGLSSLKDAKKIVPFIRFYNSTSSVPPVVENTVSELHQSSTQQHPQRDAHHTDQNVSELLQAGAQCQTKGQLQQQSCQVPQPPLYTLLTIPGVKVRLASTCHLYNQHEDEDGVKGPYRKEDEKPVPLDFRVQLEDQHDEKDKCKDPGEEHSLSQGHLHL